MGADFPKLYIHKDFRYISDKGPCAVKTELGWVLLGGKKSSVHVQSNRISTGVKTLDLEHSGALIAIKQLKNLIEY